MEIIDGKKISAQVKQELADEIAAFVAEGKKVPHLVAVLVGNDGASLSGGRDEKFRIALW